MSVIYCHHCDSFVDTDFDTDHDCRYCRDCEESWPDTDDQGCPNCGGTLEQ